MLLPAFGDEILARSAAVGRTIASTDSTFRTQLVDRSGGVASSIVVLPETRYAHKGDAHIAYQVVGEGDLDLVLVSAWFSHSVLGQCTIGRDCSGLCCPLSSLSFVVETNPYSQRREP
jgi:hypothetical protein